MKCILFFQHSHHSLPSKIHLSERIAVSCSVTRTSASAGTKYAMWQRSATMARMRTVVVSNSCFDRLLTSQNDFKIWNFKFLIDLPQPNCQTEPTFPTPAAVWTNTTGLIMAKTNFSSKTAPSTHIMLPAHRRQSCKVPFFQRSTLNTDSSTRHFSGHAR